MSRDKSDKKVLAVINGFDELTGIEAARFDKWYMLKRQGKDDMTKAEQDDVNKVLAASAMVYG